MRTGNPALNDKTFGGFQPGARAATADAMTIQGTVNKTGMLLLTLVLAASYTWSLFFRSSDVQAIAPWMIGGTIGGLVFAMITIFAKTWAPVTAPIYAALEGLCLGGLSAMFEVRFPGIVIQSVALTFGTLFCLLLAYKSRLIQATENFKLGVVAATGGICLVYLATMILGLFGVSIPYIHESGMIGIGFSLFIVVIAALNLVLDFDFIESGAKHGAPKYMEWYAAFGLLVTLVWLYLEMLRLLSKLKSRD